MSQQCNNNNDNNINLNHYNNNNNNNNNYYTSFTFVFSIFTPANFLVSFIYSRG